MEKNFINAGWINRQDRVPSCPELDSAISQTNHDPTNNWQALKLNEYALDNDLSSGQKHPRTWGLMFTYQLEQDDEWGINSQLSFDQINYPLT